MTKARDNFTNAIQDAERILDAYDQLNQLEGREREPEELKRAALIMTLTAWETYVEDVIVERLESDLRVLKGSKVGEFVKQTLEQDLKYFHTPNTKKTRDIMQRFLGVDVVVNWDWLENDTKQVTERLDGFIKKRGEAVHRSVSDKQAPHLVNRKEMDKCLVFFKKLVESTDSAILSS